MTKADEPPRPLAALVRGWRRRRSLTQAQLAERANLNVRTVRRIESGDSGECLQIATTNLLADALELEPGERTLFIALARGIHPPSHLGPTISPSGGVVPVQLPNPSPTFTGRVVELSTLGHIDDPSAAVVAQIDGMGGIGKSTLAVQAAHQLAHRFADGQIYLDLHGHASGLPPVRPSAALESALRALGAPGHPSPSSLDEQAALYRSCLAGRRVLILLDNALDESQVKPLLPGSPGCLVLITGRRRLVGIDLTHSISLHLMSPAESALLYTRAVGQERLQGTSPAQLLELAELCGRLPLAIKIAAARMRLRPAWTTADLLDRLHDHATRLRELEGGPGLSIASMLDASYRQLADQDQHLYRLLGRHTGSDFDVGAAAALAGVPAPAAEEAVERLMAVQLVQERSGAPGRFQFHELIRNHAAQLTGSVPDQGHHTASPLRLLTHDHR